MTEKENDIVQHRPFILSILCIALFVYTGILSLVFLFSIIFNNWISNTISDFFPERNIENRSILILSVIGFLLNGISFFSTYTIWKLRKSGLYLFSVASILFLIYPFFLGFGNYYSVVVMIVIVGLLFLFYRRFK